MRGWVQMLVHGVVDKTVSKCIEDQAECERKICDDQCWDSSLWDDWGEEGNGQSDEKVDMALYNDILDEVDRESRECTGDIQAVMESRVKQERKKEIQRKVRGRKNKELVPPKKNRKMTEFLTRQKISWYNEGENVD